MYTLLEDGYFSMIAAFSKAHSGLTSKEIYGDFRSGYNYCRNKIKIGTTKKNSC